MREVDSLSLPCPHCGMSSEQYSPAPMHLPPYTLLDQRYLIGRVIGAGGFGLTYIALDTRLSRRTAVKELFVPELMVRKGRELALKEPACEREVKCVMLRFRNQMQLLASQGDVPGVVKIQDFFHENHTSYQVLEYLEGRTLREELLRVKRRLTLKETLALLAPVMEALEVLHRRGVLHLDVSGDNIMLLRDGGACLIDPEGYGDTAGEGRAPGIVRGSYSPIEQAEGAQEAMGSWTDVYSLSVCIYYCICGRLPKAARDRASDLDLIFPSALGASLTPGQERVLLKALALRPKDRISEIQTLREGLEAEEKYSPVDSRRQGVSHSNNLSDISSILPSERQEKPASDLSSHLPSKKDPSSKIPIRKNIPAMIKTLLSLLVTALLLAAAVLWSSWRIKNPMTEPVSSDFSDGYVICAAEDPTFVLNVNGNETRENANLDIMTDRGLPCQSFYLVPQEAPYYRLVSVSADLDVTVQGNKAGGEVDVRLHRFRGWEGQLWELLLEEDGTYRIRSALGCLLDNYGGTLRDGNNVWTYEDNGSESQRWLVVQREEEE